MPGSKALIRRTGESGETNLTLGPVHLDASRRLVLVNGVSVELTYKEFELLQLLMRNHGIVVPRDTIMERVWKENLKANPAPLICISSPCGKNWGMRGKSFVRCAM